MSTILSPDRYRMPVPQSLLQSNVDSLRYAKIVEVSKRIRWDIDRDVIRGRTLDFAKRFLPDGLSRGRPPRVSHRGRAAPAEPDPGPHLRQHVRPRRALHRRQGARREPRARAGRPERAAGARALRRRRAQAPGAVPPHRADVRGRHARRLHLRRRNRTPSRRPCSRSRPGRCSPSPATSSSSCSRTIGRASTRTPTCPSSGRTCSCTTRGRNRSTRSSTRWSGCARTRSSRRRRAMRPWTT